MHKYVMMGVQGSGKGTHSQMLAADLDIVHISVGDIFRWHVQNHTKLGAHVRRIMAAGELVSDDLVQAVIRDRLTEHDWNFGFVIDGFPRNRRQAEFFLENYDIDGVIVLDLPDSEVRRRVLNRRQCADCGMDYHLIDSRPTVAGKCDECGGELVTREDDTEEALAVRLRAVPRGDQPGPGAVPAQGVRHHGRRAARTETSRTRSGSASACRRTSTPDGKKGNGDA